MVKKTEKETVYTTMDGNEFYDPQAAEQHEQILTAQRAFESAERSYGDLLAKTFRTADGKPFDPLLWHYYAVQHHGNARPTVVEYTLYRYSSDLQWSTHCWHYEIYATNEPRLCIAVRESDRSYTIAISDLYSTRQAAEVARDAKWEKFIAWEQEDLRKSQALRR